MSENRFIPVGTIVKAHGLKGEVVLDPVVASPEELSGLDVFYVQNRQKMLEPLRRETSKLVLKSGRFSFFVKFVQIQSKLEADALVGSSLFADSAAMLTEESIHTPEQLRGFRVSDSGAGVEGRVVEAHLYPGQTVLEIEIAGQNVLVPFVDAFVKRVDWRKKSIVMTQLQMLLDV